MWSRCQAYGPSWREPSLFEALGVTKIRAQILRNSPHEWRVLEGGTGPALLFLHGAGGSAESFLGVLEALSSDFRIIAPDLPGHGATRLGAKGRSGLNAMAEDVASLVRQHFEAPLAVIGHSAGAAVALRLSEHLSPRGHFLINPALDPFEGVAGWAFPVLARGLAVAPFSADLLAGLFGRERRIAELLEATGSAVTPQMKQRYLALAQDPTHIRGTLAMMAAWEVSDLRRRLPDYHEAVEVLIAKSDGTIDPSAMETAAQEIPGAKIIKCDGGHLIQEEKPQHVAELIAEFVTKLTA